MPTKLPSGLTLDLQGLTARDFRYLANEEVLRNDMVEDFILKGRASSVLDMGPYTFPPGGIDWSEILIGDSTYAFLAIRNVSFPDKPFEFPVKCGNSLCKLSKTGFEWTIDVGALLKQKARFLSDEDRAMFKTGNKFPGVMPNGTAYTYKLRTRAEARRFQALVQQIKESGKKKRDDFNLLVSSVAFSIRKIEAIPEDKNSLASRTAYLEDLPIAEFDSIMAEMESHDCGIETTIQALCPKCDSTKEMNLPFDRTFFLPMSGKKKVSTEEAKAMKTIHDNDEDEEEDAFEGVTS